MSDDDSVKVNGTEASKSLGVRISEYDKISTLALKLASAFGFAIVLIRVAKVGHLPDFTWADIGTISVSVFLVALFILLVIGSIVTAPGILMRDFLELDKKRLSDAAREGLVKERRRRGLWLFVAIFISQPISFYTALHFDEVVTLLVLVGFPVFLALVLVVTAQKRHGINPDLMTFGSLVAALVLIASSFLLLTFVLVRDHADWDAPVWAVITGCAFVYGAVSAIFAYKPKDRRFYFAAFALIVVLFFLTAARQSIFALGLGERKIPWIVVDVKDKPILDQGDIEYQPAGNDALVITNVSVELRLGRDIVFSTRSHRDPKLRSARIVIPKDTLKGMALAEPEDVSKKK